MLRFRSICAFAIAVLATTGYGQATDSASTKRLKRFVVLSTLGYGATMTGLGQIWYSDLDKQSFRFFNDSREWYQVDKLGHSFASYHLTGFVRGELARDGVSPNRATHIAAFSSFLAVSSIEIFDGYSSGYGASASDLAANAFGALLFWSQQRVWQEQRIRLKFSFHRTDYPAQRPSLLGKNILEEVIKDYNGQTYWLSMDIDKFVVFPKWLNLTIGYGAEEFLYASVASNTSEGLSPHRQYYLGLDFDLTDIHTRSKFVKTLLNGLSAIRLPAPALAYGQGKWTFHPLYF